MNKNSIIIFFCAALLLFPVAAFAALTLPDRPGSNIFTIDSLWGVIVNLLNILWLLFVGVSIIMLILAGFMFVTAQGDPGKIKLARDAVIWAVVGIIVAVLAFSAYGIVSNVIAPAPSPTPPPPASANGACCSGAICISQTQAECNTSGGNYRGDNSVCGPFICS